MPVETKDHLLLTGAGFTKNYGGFLAKDMWAQIYNHPAVRHNQTLRTVLQSNYDFESVYSMVLNAPHLSGEEKEAIKAAVESAYKKLDDTTKDWVMNDQNPLAFNVYGLGNLFTRFVGAGSKRGLFFTLNQDLVMERQHGYRSPGVPWFNSEFYNLRSLELLPRDFVTVPADKTGVLKDINQNDFAYIKLHGSYGWRSSDGSSQMVLGKSKTEIIDKEPVLKEYFDIFKSVLNSEGKRLLVIGYGFMDEHVNLVLLEAVKEHGLELYLINPTPFGEFKERLPHYVQEIFERGMQGYYPLTLRDIFPPSQAETTYIREIRSAMDL